MPEERHTEHIAGQLTTDGGELVAPSHVMRRYYPLCCDKALMDTGHFCVCAFVTVCPEHGRKHNGTHD